MRSLSLSANPWVPREKGAGVVTSRPVRVDRDRRRLAFVSWEERPFDHGRGTLAMQVRTVAEKYDLDRAAWVDVPNGGRLDLPLGEYLQWRIEMTSRDLYRPPGARDLVFGFARTDPGDAALEQRPPPRWPWLLLALPVAAALVWVAVGRRSLWQKKTASR
jgi:hypothetical protein